MHTRINHESQSRSRNIKHRVEDLRKTRLVVCGGGDEHRNKDDGKKLKNNSL
jgi:hypothetical protein